MIFERSEILQDMWKSVNEECFESKLTPPKSIGWLDLSSEPGLEEPFGMYLVSQQSIGISRRFHGLEEAIRDLKRDIETLPESSPERAAALARLMPLLDNVYRLVLHEAVHQAEWQSTGSTGPHRESFIEYATKAAKALGVAPPTLANADQWPGLLPMPGFKT